MFLLHSPRGRPHWTLSSILLYGVRTFLGSCDPRLPVFLKSILLKGSTSPANSLAIFTAARLALRTGPKRATMTAEVCIVFFQDPQADRGSHRRPPPLRNKYPHHALRHQMIMH